MTGPKYKRANEKIWVGRTAIGAESVQVLVDFADGGGHFQMMPTLECNNIHPDLIPYLPYVVIGLKQDSWRDVMEIMLHEATEFAFCRMKCRYDNTESEALNTASFIFIAGHVQFTEIMAMASEFLDDMFMPISTLFLEEQKIIKTARLSETEKEQEAVMLKNLREQGKELAVEKKKRLKNRIHKSKLKEQIHHITHPKPKKLGKNI